MFLIVIVILIRFHGTITIKSRIKIMSKHPRIPAGKQNEVSGQMFRLAAGASLKSRSGAR
jgi:hypothetical protein